MSSSSSSISFLSVCSGIEAASVALEPLGFTPAMYSEIEKFPRAVLGHRQGASDIAKRPRGRVPLWGDFSALRVRHFRRLGVELPELLIGGTPCQAFSIAGARRGLADDRGNLSLIFVRLAHALRRTGSLRWLVWENVPGALSVADNAFGCFLGGIVGADDPLLPCERPRRGKSNRFWAWRAAGKWPVLDDEGEETGKFIERAEGHIPRWPSPGMVAGPFGRAAWRILDAQYFGLAQRRKRLFVVASFGDGGDPATVLFEPKSMRGHFAKGRKTREEIAPTIAARTSGGGGLGADFDLNGGLIEVAHALRADGFDALEDGTGRGTPLVPVLAGTLDTAGDRGGTLQDTVQGRLVAYGGNNCGGAIDVAAALNAKGGAGRMDFESETLIAFLSKDSGADACTDLAPTLRAMNFDASHANAGGQLAVAGHSGVRRLTPRECERLQGFPDVYPRPHARRTCRRWPALQGAGE